MTSISYRFMRKGKHHFLRSRLRGATNQMEDWEDEGSWSSTKELGEYGASKAGKRQTSASSA